MHHVHLHVPESYAEDRMVIVKLNAYREALVVAHGCVPDMSM